jgi:ATP-binding cassette subfamily F protein uup
VLEPALADAELYTRDPTLFDKKSHALAQAKAALHAAEEKWLELESLRLSFEGQTSSENA